MTSPRRKLTRYEGLNHARYLTISCYQRLPLFGSDAIKDAFVEHLKFVQRVMEFELHSWVIMPEHVHLLLRPVPLLAKHTAPFGLQCGTRIERVRATGDTQEKAQSVTQFLNRLKAPFARKVIARWRELDAPILKRISDAKGQPRFWQSGGGYDRNIFSPGELREKIDYIHANPVRRGLVNRVQNYRWSSIHAYTNTPMANQPVITKQV